MKEVHKIFLVNFWFRKLTKMILKFLGNFNSLTFIFRSTLRKFDQVKLQAIQIRQMCIVELNSKH